jgi:trimeric autotransporter adhesin
MNRYLNTIAAILGCAALSSLPAAAQTQLLQVQKSDATNVMQVADDAGLVVAGALGAGAIPASGGGVRLMWYPGKAAFRVGGVDGAGAGSWDDANIGQYSMSLGRSTTASGTHSLALNADATASGDRSVAMNGGTTASGDLSTAMGQATTASGFAALATGVHTTAAGTGGLATGDVTSANGLTSVALGFHVSAGDGSFVFGDRSSSTDGYAAGVNQFLVRAYGGTGFNSAPNIGCDLPPGQGAWACTSSRLAKEGFKDVDGEDVLSKLSRIRIQSWRYLGTSAVHVGPVAEDFRAAFGLGEGTTKIATVDAEGISLVAVQALERRTARLQEENDELRAELAALRQQVQKLSR